MAAKVIRVLELQKEQEPKEVSLNKTWGASAAIPILYESLQGLQMGSRD